MNLFIKTAVSINGTAKPKEKTVSSQKPLNTFPSLEANINIEARTGPTQGVHPSAKAQPVKKMATMPFPKKRSVFPLREKCLFKKPILKTPAILSPNSMTAAPPIQRKIFLFSAKNPPKALTDIPRIIKTELNPKTKTRVLKKTVFLEEFISFKERPVISEIKAGIKGKIQGLTKAKSPAVKLIRN
jgi:hypothetical protein